MVERSGCSGGEETWAGTQMLSAWGDREASGKSPEFCPAHTPC